MCFEKFKMKLFMVDDSKDSFINLHFQSINNKNYKKNDIEEGKYINDGKQRRQLFNAFAYEFHFQEI